MGILPLTRVPAWRFVARLWRHVSDVRPRRHRFRALGHGAEFRVRPLALAPTAVLPGPVEDWLYAGRGALASGALIAPLHQPAMMGARVRALVTNVLGDVHDVEVRAAGDVGVVLRATRPPRPGFTRHAGARESRQGHAPGST
jgi:hypothetical protein